MNTREFSVCEGGHSPSPGCYQQTHTDANANNTFVHARRPGHVHPHQIYSSSGNNMSGRNSEMARALSQPFTILLAIRF